MKTLICIGYIAVFVTLRHYMAHYPFMLAVSIALITGLITQCVRHRLSLLEQISVSMIGMLFAMESLWKPYPSLSQGLGGLWLLLAAILMVRDWWYRRHETWMPPELSHASLVMNEIDIFIKSPYRIACRPDRVYRRGSGSYVPVEYKTRNGTRAYETDVAQLSLQGWALRQKGYATENYGFVVCKDRDTNKERAIKVALRDDAFCIGLIERYFALKNGTATPQKVLDNRCRECAYEARC